MRRAAPAAGGGGLAPPTLAVLGPWTGRLGWAEAPSLGLNALLLLAAVAAAMAVGLALGVVLERVIVRPVYGRHMFQILITLGATIVLEELIRLCWGGRGP